MQYGHGNRKNSLLHVLAPDLNIKGNYQTMCTRTPSLMRGAATYPVLARVPVERRLNPCTQCFGQKFAQGVREAAEREQEYERERLRDRLMESGYEY